MSTNFPSSLDNSTTLPAESANIPLSTNHVTAHQNIQDAIEAIEAKVGVDSSAVTTSLDYLVKNTSSSNPGHKHTLANGATDVTASASELNILDGATLSTTELNYVDGVTSAIQTQLDLKALDSAVVHDTGNETIDGIKTFTSDPIIPDEAYGSGWNGVLEPPTKNAVYDKIETIDLNYVPNANENYSTWFTWEMPIHTLASTTNVGGWGLYQFLTVTSGYGAGYQTLGLSNNGGALYTYLPGALATTTGFKFSNAKKWKMKFFAKVDNSTAIWSIGLIMGNATSGIYQAHTNTASSQMRLVWSSSTTYLANSNGTNYTANTVSVTRTNWNLYELYFDGTSLYCYVNGTLAATNSTNLPTSSANEVSLNIGGDTISTSTSISPITFSLEL